jgi:hypothetical protein
MVDLTNENLARPHYRKRIIMTQAFVAIVIFLSGIIIGSTGTIVLLKNRGIWNPPRPPKPPQGMAAEIAHEIGSQYGLTDVQIKEVEKVFEKAGQSLESVRQEFENKMKAGEQQITTDMKSVLSPEQFTRWQHDFKSRLRPPQPGHGPDAGPGPELGHGPNGPGPEPGFKSKGPGTDPREFGPNPPERH